MHTIATTLVLCFVSAPAMAAAQVASPAALRTPSEALTGFDAHIDQILRDWNVPGVAVSIVKDGKPVLVKGYGVRDPATGQPMTEDTVVPIGSMSKSFTSFSAGLLVDDGKMSLDAPASTYIEGLRLYDPAATAGLTVRDMLSHRAGYPRHDSIWFHNANLPRDELLKRLPYLESTRPLRTHFEYNNIMFVLAGITVERVAGVEWETFVDQRIFQPLKMSRTFFGYERAMADPNHSGGREVIAGKPVNVGLFKMGPIVNPAGGIYSSARDLTNWMLVQLEGGRFEGRQIIQPASLAEMHRTQIPVSTDQRDPEILSIGYGMGWFTDVYRGRYRIGDPGEINGSSTYISLLPSERLGVIVLVNHGGSELPELLSREVMDRFLGVSGKDWVGEGLARKRAGEASALKASQQKAAGSPRKAKAKASHPLAEYAGGYSHPGYGPLIVTLEGGRLIGQFNEDRSPLSPAGYDVFAAQPTDPESLWRNDRIQFVSDFDGRISGVRMVVEPALAAATFTRLPDQRLSDPDFLKGLAGTYFLDGENVVMTLAGNRLSMTFPGGNPGELVPALGGEFTWARSREWRIAFPTDASGRATAMVLTTPSATYEGKRVE